jgi:hypothetical protein
MNINITIIYLLQNNISLYQLTNDKWKGEDYLLIYNIIAMKR